MCGERIKRKEGKYKTEKENRKKTKIEKKRGVMGISPSYHW
jgi:hypothetical protein